mmetsp:Transcript_10002/g.12484  ORF Transcript_10002/g.12484 Transcript_10002/m.12484 type:complete len:89 (+) Transcript_10002:602-868(+)
MGKSFEYRTFLESLNDSKLISYTQAKIMHLKPWFDHVRASRTGISSRNIHKNSEQIVNRRTVNSVGISGETIKNVDVAAFLNHLHKHK